MDPRSKRPPLPSEGTGQATSPRVSYKLGNLVEFTLPENLDSKVASQRIDVSKLAGKRMDVSAIAPLTLTDVERDALRWILAAFGSGETAGNEYRAVVPIGPGKSAPVGQVILRYDAQLNSTAVLVGRGVPLGGPQEKADEAELRKRLLADYGLAAVDGPWTTIELLKVHGAFALLNADERRALAGIALRRVGQIQPDQEARKGVHVQAQFNHAPGPLRGWMGTIYVSDKAFTADAGAFWGGADGVPARPPCFHLILHEVGHAIDAATARASAWNNAAYALNRAGSTKKYQQMEPLDHDKVVQAAQLRHRSIKDEESNDDLAVAAYTAVRKQAADAGALIEACRERRGVMAGLADLLSGVLAGNDAPKAALEQVRVVQAELEAVQAVYTRMLKVVPELESKRPDLVPPSEFAEIREALHGLDHEPWSRFHDAVALWADIQERVAQWRAIYVDKTTGAQTTERRRKFMAYVLKKKIPPDLTEYSGKHWPDEPDELLAEAFSLWKVDPVLLRRHSRDLHDYFTRGEHLIDE
jgi:hypothetical protein